MPKSKVKIAKRRDRQRAVKRQALLVQPDYGTTERWQYATRKYEVMEKNSSNVVARVVEECALDALHVQGRISGAYRAAGLRLRHAYIRAKVERPRIGRYDVQPRIQKGSGHPGFERSTREEEAYDEWRAAMRNIPPRSVDIIVSVCCIGDAPTLALMPQLNDGLEALKRYFMINI